MTEKKIKKIYIFSIILIICSALTLSGCSFSFESGEIRQVSGQVTFNDEPLENVNIQTDFKVYAKTNANGYYTFATRASSLTIFARKSGYIFLPKTIEISQTETFCNFLAQIAQNLTGTLKLSAVMFLPNSISSIVDNNFSYLQNSTSHLKISQFVVKFNHDTIYDLDEITFTEKNKWENIYASEEDFEWQITNGQTNFVLEFLLKTYFTYNNGQNESVFIEPYKILNISTVLDSGNLNEQNQIKFIASGITSTSNGFSYDIQFVFDFVS